MAKRNAVSPAPEALPIEIIGKFAAKAADAEQRVAEREAEIERLAALKRAEEAKKIEVEAMYKEYKRLRAKIRQAQDDCKNSPRLNGWLVDLDGIINRLGVLDDPEARKDETEAREARLDIINWAMREAVEPFRAQIAEMEALPYYEELVSRFNREFPGK